jgi:hypothetical protein
MSVEVEKIYEPIGKLIVRFQLLELMTGVLLIELTKQDYDVGLRLNFQMNFSKLVAALASVAGVTIHDESLGDEVRLLTVQLAACGKERNRIVHSSYFEVEGKLRRTKVAVKKKELQKILYHSSVEEVNEVTRQIDETKKQLLQVVEKLKAKELVSSRFFL